MVAGAPSVTRLRRTSGVRPMVSALSANQVISRRVGEVDAAVGGGGLAGQNSKMAPPAGAGVLAGLDRRRARVTADARVARVVQRMNQQAVLGDVRADVVTTPVVKRRQLVAARAAIFAEGRDVAPPATLRPAQPVDQHRRALRLEVSEQRGLL